MIGDPYIRKKGNKFIIEQKIDGKTKYIMTLPSVHILINTFRSHKEDAKASSDKAQETINSNQMFAQPTLNAKSAQDALNKLMEDLL